MKRILLLNRRSLLVFTRLDCRYHSYVFLISLCSVSSLLRVTLKLPDWNNVTVVLVCLPYCSRSFETRSREMAALSSNILCDSYIETIHKCLPRQGDILSAHYVTSPQVITLATKFCRFETCERGKVIMCQR